MTEELDFTQANKALDVAVGKIIQANGDEQFSGSIKDALRALGYFDGWTLNKWAKDAAGPLGQFACFINVDTRLNGTVAAIGEAKTLPLAICKCIIDADKLKKRGW